MPCLTLPKSRSVQTEDQSKSFRKLPEADLEQIDKIIQDGESLIDLWEVSPFRLESDEPLSEMVTDILFPGNPLLCCGWDFWRCQTKPRERWRSRLSSMQFVPSPMREVKGRTLKGKISQRSLHNLGSRRFLVIEFDFREKNSDGSNTQFTALLRKLSGAGFEIQDLYASLLLHLAERAPLALVVHSGGKSLHGWFYCLGQLDHRLYQFMEYAVSFGADPITWTRCQLVRMPEGLRDTGIRQRIFFFNPGVIK